MHFGDTFRKQQTQNILNINNQGTGIFSCAF